MMTQSKYSTPGGLQPCSLEMADALPGPRQVSPNCALQCADGDAQIAMEISIQYLESTPATAGISPAEAHRRLRDAFEHVHLSEVLLGWDLDPRVIEACAKECTLHGADLYLWQPMLSGHGSFKVHPAWRIVALNGEPAGRADEKPEFTFMCPNCAGVMDGVLESLRRALETGLFQGVFLDRIRLPSPSVDFTRSFGCFCDACRAAAECSDLDLSAAQENLVEQLERPEGRRQALSTLLSPRTTDTELAAGSLWRLLEFRSQSITAFVKTISSTLADRGFKVGLDCFAPTLTRMVGQDLAALAPHADWIKVMTYARAFGVASLPFELVGFVDWLVAGGETEASALDCLAQATGWTLPGSREVIRAGGLPGSILTQEVRRGRSQGAAHFRAGIELLEIPDVSRLDHRQIQADAKAVHAAEPDGVVLSWDLWHMPAWRLDLAASLYGSARCGAPLADR